MEVLRKVETKFKNRKPGLVKAGALAAATTVKDHSLTSNYDIKLSNYDEEPRRYFPLPVPPKRPSRPVNTNIQHNLNISLVLMILFATSGLLLWNGEKLTASCKKSGKVEDIVIEEGYCDRRKKKDIVFEWNGKKWKFSRNTDGDKVYICNGEEIRLSYIFDQEKDKIQSYFDQLRAENQDEEKQSGNTGIVWLDLYDQEMAKYQENQVLEKLIKDFSNDNLLSILDASTKVLKQCDPYYQPYYFITSLACMDKLLKSVNDEDAQTEILSKVVQYMKDFSELHPDFSKGFDGFEKKYNFWIELMHPYNTLLFKWKSLERKS